MFITGMWIMFWFSIFVLIAPLLLKLLDCAINDADQRNFVRVRDDCRARGLSPQEMFAEIDTRTEFARLRRIASERVMADSQNWKQHLDESVSEAFEHLADINPELLPLLGGMLKHTSYSDILYEDACAMVEQVTRPRRMFDQDFSAGLRTLR